MRTHPAAVGPQMSKFPIRFTAVAVERSLIPRPLVRQSAVSALFCLPLLLSVPLYALAADQHALLLGDRKSVV